MRYILANFAYGTGPYLRTTELAMAVSTQLQARGLGRLGVIVPWVYAERQRAIMAEEFGPGVWQRPECILLDPTLGRLLGRVFYGDNTYAQTLEDWLDRGQAVSREARGYLAGQLVCQDLAGRSYRLGAGAIALEVNRAPRLDLGVRPSYSATFAHISSVLGSVLEEPEGTFALGADLVRRAIPLAQAVEAAQELHLVAEPSTFSYQGHGRVRHRNEIAVPPLVRPMTANNDPIADGIYVTITGIPGLERLYSEAQSLGLKLYSNDPAVVPGSQRLLPHIIPNRCIRLQFARSGWSSIWISIGSGTPFVTPPFDPRDDPEIFFNNRCLEELGLGLVYRGEPLSEILSRADRLRPGIQALNRSLGQRFGTLDGNQFGARIIADHVLGLGLY